MSVKKRLMVGLMAGGVMAAMLPGVASAIPSEPVGGCPTGDGWYLSMLTRHNPAVDNGNAADQNGDGYACFRQNRGLSMKNGYATYTWKDNTNPLDEV